MPFHRRRFRLDVTLRFCFAILVTTLALFATGCGDATSDDSDTDAIDDVSAGTIDDASTGIPTEEETEQLMAVLGFDSEHDADIPELDLETLVAETPTLTLQAQAWENSFVGELTEELLVGIALDSSDALNAREIRVYLCDSQEIVSRMTGELEDGRATLTDDTAVIELTVTESEISGTVELFGEAGESFSASPATGDAGVFVATDIVDEGEIWGGWIVLHDGRQRGSICFSADLARLCLVFVEGQGGKAVSK
jgi:hypothetical protein